jgi:hypothetical protein
VVEDDAAAAKPARKVGAGHSGARNLSARAAEKGGAKLEDSATGKPSRKSTRKSTGHVDQSTSFRTRATLKASAPTTQASKSKAAQGRGRTKAH